MTRSLLPILLESAMRAAIAAVAIGCGLRIFRVRNVPAQKAAWGLVLLAGLAMPFVMRSPWLPGWAAVKLPVSLPRAGTPAAADRIASEQDMTTPEAQVSVAIRPHHRHAVQTTPMANLDAVPTSEPESLPVAPLAQRPPVRASATSLSEILLSAGWCLYLAVCAFLLLRLIWGLGLSLWLWKRADPVDMPGEPEFPALVRVRSSSSVSSPVNIGSGILLPANYAEWDEEKLRVVLAHEFSHVRQRDFYLQFLAGLYASLTWFSPLGWWLKHKLSDLGEAISDRAGLAVAASPSTYASMLLEFAALPRPTLNGVAMAHSRNLSHRIERLLNEASFHLAFAGRRRALLIVLVSSTLIAAAAMVRVQAASAPQVANSSQPAAQDQVAAPSAVTGQSNPQPAQVNDSTGAQSPAASTSPEPPPAVSAPPAPGQGPAPSPAPAPPSAPEAGVQGSFPVMPPMPAVHVEIPPMPAIHVNVPMPEMAYAFAGQGNCFANGDSYAIVGDPGSKTRFCGDWDNEGQSDVEKARSQAHGHFLLFRHEGKLYIVDDPAIVSQLEAMDKSREDLREQMRALGKQMREEGEQARLAARKARETAKTVPAPDLSKEVAALDATAASLKAQQGATVSREQLEELQREISELQRRVIQAEIQAEVGVNMNQFNSDMAKLGQEQGQYGEQMGKLGAEMGHMARENELKIMLTIDESLKNGKARPVN